MIAIRCRRCGSLNLRKNGRTATGQQKFHCKDCNAYDTLDTKEHERAHKRGVGGRDYTCAHADHCQRCPGLFRSLWFSDRPAIHSTDLKSTVEYQALHLRAKFLNRQVVVAYRMVTRGGRPQAAGRPALIAHHEAGDGLPNRSSDARHYLGHSTLTTTLLVLL